MYVLKSQYTDVKIPDDVSIADLILERVSLYGEKPALIDGVTGHIVTYNDFYRLVHAVGSGLARHGVNKGDVLCVFAANCIEYAILFHSVTAIGAILTTCNPLYTTGELTNQLKDSGTRYVITQSPFLNKVKEAVARCPKVKHIFCMGERFGDVYDFETLMKDDGSHFPKVYIHPKQDIALLPYSSGTTGRSKGVMLTHHNLVANALQLSSPEVGLAQHEDVYVGFLPFYHIYAIMAMLNLSLWAGSTTIILPRFEPEYYLKTVQKYKATFLHVVPPVAIFLAKHPMVSSFDLSSVRTVFCGAAPLDSQTSKEMMKRLSIKQVLQGYGMTETSPGITMCSDDNWKYGSAGVILPNTYCKVVDISTGTVLGAHQKGEICCLGPQVMKGYLNNDEATRNIMETDGWLHTGDIGYYDEDGHFFIVDRLKELIKYKGFQVPPAELEALLLAHPSVADAAVIGIPDNMAGELPKAYVVLKPNKQISETNLYKYVEGKVAHYKRLRGGIEFVTEIPKSAAGKILRRVLKEKAMNNLKSKL